MRVVGQTLFLGASVVSFSSNIGWGGNNSSITVELIEDFQPFGKTPFRKFDQAKTADYGDPYPTGTVSLPSGHPGDRNLGNDFYNISHYGSSINYDDNHYYSCSGNACYVDELGRPYVENVSKEKNVPGKVYYEWVNNRFVSKYWYKEDPGFFAVGTRWNPDGVYEETLGRDDPNQSNLSSKLYIYDIIDTPVYFKFDNFEFIGLVRNWERNNRPGGITYSVTIESFDSLLDSCHCILQSFNGAIFNVSSSALENLLNNTQNLSSNQIGGPTNFPLAANFAQKFDENISRGNIPNVFNVYGFLESMGSNRFGGAKLNSEGLRANDILDSIQTLTSSNNSRPLDKAFSPFGRILTKTIANARTSEPLRNFRSFGIISPFSPERTPDNPSKNYNSFRLDLSSLPRPPDSYRIQGNPSLSISNIIRQICDDSGVDFLSIVVPVPTDSTLDFIIKIVTVDRTKYNPLYEIPNVVKALETNGYQIENSSFGQEKNNNYTRKIIFGGNQQRLYQVKNYRLSYNQTNYIYNTITKQFMNLDSTISKNKISKIRSPDLSSTRNKLLSDFINPTETNLFLRDDIDKDIRFNIPVGEWGDIEAGRKEIAQTGPNASVDLQDYIVRGNYESTLLLSNEPSITGTRNVVSSGNNNFTGLDEIRERQIPVYERYVSLFNDVISPYFGLKTENNAPIGDGTNEFRLPRPVLLDTWTNQITVVFDMNELPLLSIGEPLSLYNPNVFGADAATNGASTGLGGINVQLTPNQQQQQTTPTNFGLPPSPGVEPTRTLNYNNPGFTIKETEFRCTDWDSYLTYCLGKSIYSKPDLFVMLVNAYQQKGIFLSAPSSNNTTGDVGPTLNGPTGSLTSNLNINDNGVSSDPRSSFRTKMDINWDLWLNHNFIKDLQILFEFIKSIGDKYYGKQYAIKAPSLYSYKDTQYANVTLPSKLGNISIYQGSNEIFYDYELVDGAWEEYGNYIDDSIVCGDKNWHVLRNEDGLIPTLVGYNSSNNIDYVTKYWCELPYERRISELQKKLSIAPIKDLEDIQQKINIKNEYLIKVEAAIAYITGPGQDLPDGWFDVISGVWSFLPLGWEWSLTTAYFREVTLVSVKALRQETLKQIRKLQIQKNKLINASLEKFKELQNQKAALEQALKAAIDQTTGISVAQEQLDRWQREFGKKYNELASLYSLVEQLRTAYRDCFDCSDPNKISIPSLDIVNLEPGSYALLSKKIDNTDAFNSKVDSSKLYVKSDSEKIIFLNPISLSDPRIIVNTPGVELANASYSYLTDPNLTVISNIAMEDFCIFANLKNDIVREGPFGTKTIETSVDSQESQYLNYLLSYIYPIDPRRLVPLGASTNNSPNHHMVKPKMATPFFIAAPIKINRAVYGPWTNYPGLVMNSNLADNLIGNVKIEQNSEYVPWNYGGMSYLDRVVSYSMNSDINYQSIIENGRVSIVGPPIFSIGGTFSYENIQEVNNYRINSNYLIYDNNYYEIVNTGILYVDIPNKNTINYNIPVLQQNSYGSSAIISNISIQQSIDGIRTSYSFQTYNPKTGLFNKQISDNIKKQNSQLLKFNKLFFGKSNNISNKQLKNFLTIKEKAQQSRESYQIGKHSTKLFGTSPVELIIGQAAGFAPIPIGTIKNEEFNDSIRNHHFAAIYPASEVGAELLNDYDSKAAMSLDGLLSPISFYPTRLNTTYSISSYAIKDETGSEPLYCPRCSNKRTIEITYVNYDTSNRASQPINIACPVCSKSIVNDDNKSIKPASAPDNINLYSLNPIIVSNGEFRNPHTEQVSPKHSLLALARGETLPVGDKSFLLHGNLKDPNNSDYDEIDSDKKIKDNISVLMNQRFFGLRGPLMLHSWGFDTEGYPVPNANDQPLKFDTQNRPLRFILTNGLNDLTQEGKHEPGKDNNGNIIRLGDIVPKNYEFKNGRYVKISNKKSIYFHDKWGERPDLWPVGPIDLRWDNKRKVWDASGGGCKEEILPPFIVSNKNDTSTLTEFLNNKTENKCPYKMVYVTLEQDMTKIDNFETTIPARAFIDDIEYSKEPLQNNYRRLVYVIDTAGYTAPRGAKLLCRYNRDNGFYEPITKPILTALGTITGTTAKIQMSYTNARRSGTIPEYVYTFDNPLKLTTGSKGLFNYINGKWTLISSGNG